MSGAAHTSAETVAASDPIVVGIDGAGIADAVVEPTATIDTFETVFQRDYAAVARMAYLLLGATGEAEEVAQEVFATLLQRWDRVANPSGFVRTAAINRCRDLGRRRSTRQRAIARLVAVDDGSTVDRVADPDLIAALQGLDLPLRELIVLRYYLDHTVDEIAELTDTPAGTVKSRLHRALGRLNEHLTGE